MLISDEYRRQNRQLHREAAGYGSSGHLWSGFVWDAMERYDCRSVLDYGAGKRSLARYMPSLRGEDNLYMPMGRPEAVRAWEYHAYDPALPSLAHDPEPADCVACLDVLEHIEPAYLPDVLDHLAALTRRVGIFVVSHRLANRLLPNGYNTHRIVEDHDWWTRRLEKRFHLDVDRCVRMDDATLYEVVSRAYLRRGRDAAAD